MFDEETKNKLSELQATIKERGLKAKILPPSSLHLTLVFLGEVPEERLIDIKPVTEKAKVSLPLVLKFHRLRYFGRSLVLEVEREKSLMDCQSAQVRFFLERGFSFEDKRKFIPHITLFRRADVHQAIEWPEEIDFPIVAEKEVVLQSILGGLEPDYREVFPS